MTLWPGAPYEYVPVAGGLVFAAGACPITDEGAVVAPGDLDVQSAQAIENLRVALAREGAGLRRHRAGHDLRRRQGAGRPRAGLERHERHLDRAPTTLLGVSLLGYPDQLVEIEAIAVIQPGGATA